MIYVTQGYSLKEFETKEQAFDYIISDVSRHNLSYKQIYNKTDRDVQIIVFQYYTLYMEAYIIHKTMDLRTRRTDND